MCIGSVAKYPHSLMVFWSNVIQCVGTQLNDQWCWFKWPIVHEITSSRWLLIYCISCICPSIWRLSVLMMQGRAAQCMVMGAWRAQDHYFPISPSLTPRMRDWGSAGAIMCHWHRVSQHPPSWPLILTSPPPLVSRHWQQGSGLYHRVMFSSVHCAGLCNV